MNHNFRSFGGRTRCSLDIRGQGIPQILFEIVFVLRMKDMDMRNQCGRRRLGRVTFRTEVPDSHVTRNVLLKPLLRRCQSNFHLLSPVHEDSNKVEEILRSGWMRCYRMALMQANLTQS